MEEKINDYSYALNGEKLQILNTTNGGLFSCSSCILRSVFDFIQRYNKLPINLLTDTMYFNYNPMEEHSNFLKSEHDIYSHFFKVDQLDIFVSDEEIAACKTIINRDYQYDDYKTVQYDIICPIIRKYFSVSDDVKNIILYLENEYINSIGYENICVLFYRGNDKNTETKICSYDDMIEKAREVYNENPNITFLLQSDETDFLYKMGETFPRSFRFSDEYICHTTDKKIVIWKSNSKMNNYHYGKKYIAITQIMSKCKYIIYTTGNCSIWINYFRGNADGCYQYLIDRWV